MSRTITRDDILSMAAYGRIRRQRRREIAERKRDRRVAVGPCATFYFENYDTMWLQIHEMLFVEKGGEAQIEDELAAYNPLIPRDNELVATLMFEIDDRARRQQVLGRLGGVEDTVTMEVDGATVLHVVPEQDVMRSVPGGKTSSVHFLHFPFQQEQLEAFRQPGAKVVLSIGHPEYRHMAVLPEATRMALSGDFD